MTFFLPVDSTYAAACPDPLDAQIETGTCDAD